MVLVNALLVVKVLINALLVEMVLANSMLVIDDGTGQCNAGVSNSGQ